MHATTLAASSHATRLAEAHPSSAPLAAAPALLRCTAPAAACTSAVTHNAPQCCHCGWRGDHAPNCPFR